MGSEGKIVPSVEKISEKARKKGRREVAKNVKVLERLNVEYLAPSSIKPNSYNPNRQSEHDFELLMKSMREDGFTQPIVVHKETNEIVDGEHRWRAAQALGMAEIPVVKVEMTPEQMRIATLRHNRARGSEDIELAASVLRDLQRLGAIEHAQDSLMLDDAEMNKLLDDISVEDALGDSEEFGNAWVPDLVPDHARGGNLTGSQTEQLTSVSGGNGVNTDMAMSTAAIEMARARERAMAAAKTVEEREMAARDMASIYRLSLTFTGEEGDLVKSVLGAQAPAKKLLEICKAYAEANPQ